MLRLVERLVSLLRLPPLPERRRSARVLYLMLGLLLRLEVEHRTESCTGKRRGYIMRVCLEGVSVV